MTTVGRTPSSTVPGEQGPTEARTRVGARQFWGAFAVLWVLTSAWALSSPVASGPDENVHMVKAAAVVRGQLGGESTPESPGAGVVDVPQMFAELVNYPVCFAFRGEEAADCTPELTQSPAGDTPAEAGTWVVRNNPLYYAVVGLPSLLPAHEWVLYAMRLLSAALTSAVLAWGFRELLTLVRRPLVVLGAVTAITPMVVYLNGNVNPSGLEISAAITLWIALSAMVRDPDPTRVTSRAAGIAVVAVLLANSRGLSVVYLATIAIVVAAIGPWAGVLSILRDRRTWPWLGVVAAGTGASLAWTLSAGTLEAGGAGHPELGFLSTATRTFFDTGDYVLVSIGRFGWLDTDLPTILYVLAIALLGLPMLLALSIGRTRDRLGTLLTVAVAIFLPVLVHAWQARNVGYIWTARYSMPLTVGVVVVAGFAARRGLADVPSWVAARLASTLLPLLALVQAIAFLTHLRRYTVGTQGSWRAIFAGEWSPPVHGALLTTVAVGALTVGTWLLVRDVTTDRPDGEQAAALRGDPDARTGTVEPAAATSQPRTSR